MAGQFSFVVELLFTKDTANLKIIEIFATF